MMFPPQMPETKFERMHLRLDGNDLVPTWPWDMDAFRKGAERGAYAQRVIVTGTDSRKFSATDHAMMARALRLAERGAYTTRPNPMVGCVIAQGDEVVGTGWHERKGGPHAEVFALEAAGERARGATAYVTLEPCAHVGSTGPCADALIAAGVTRVVGAMRDPFPQVDGAGFERLRAAGIEVETGLMEAQARALNRGFLSRIERGRPWLRVKLATSLDGRSALASGDSKWISGERRAARRAEVARAQPAPSSPAPAPC